MKLNALILATGTLAAKVDTANIKMKGVYDVQCTQLGMTNSKDCLFQPVGGRVNPEARSIHLFGNKEPDIPMIDPATWCQFTHEGWNSGNGLLLSTYTAVEGDYAHNTVYGDQMKGTSVVPSSGILVYGSDVDGDWTENCGQLMRLRKEGTKDRYEYVVIVAGVKSAQTANIGATEVGLMVSPRLMSSQCCTDVSCLRTDEPDFIDVPELKDCSGTTAFEIDVMVDGQHEAFGQGDQVMQLYSKVDTACPDFTPVEGEHLAQAVTMEGTFFGFVTIPGGGENASKQCGKKFDVYNAETLEKIVVTVESWRDKVEDSQRDGTFFLQLSSEDCFKLCPGQCYGGDMGYPPPHCPLSFVDEGKAPTPEPETTTTTTKETTTETVTETVTETAPTGNPGEGWTAVQMYPWNEVAEKCAFSCGDVQQPEDCGTEDKPCLASFKGKECGDVFEIQNGDDSTTFVQVADLNKTDLNVASPAWPTVCKKACTGAVSSVCRDECLDDETEEADYCNCAGCIGGGKDSEGCECEDCPGQCMKIDGSTKAAMQDGYYRFINKTDLPEPSFGRQAIPLCALAATAMA